MQCLTNMLMHMHMYTHTRTHTHTHTQTHVCSLFTPFHIFIAVFYWFYLLFIINILSLMFLNIEINE